MASNWEGKSKGTVTGYKIFIFLIHKFGIRGAYVLLYFVAFYYCFFAAKSTKAIYQYLKKILQYSTVKSLFSIYKSYLIFGKILIDKAAISSGLKNKFSYSHNGQENIKELLAKKEGGILISAHIGNFEIAQIFFDEIDVHSQINLVIADAEHRQIKEYLESVTTRSRVKLIVVQDDMSHIYQITTAINNGELVCFSGDRFIPGNKTLTSNLLGTPCKLPSGPFLLASRLKVPVLFLYVMKEKHMKYSLYAHPAQFKNRDEIGLLNEYTKSVELMLEKYPLQWFNYYDFWNMND